MTIKRSVLLDIEFSGMLQLRTEIEAETEEELKEKQQALVNDWCFDKDLDEKYEVALGSTRDYISDAWCSNIKEIT